MAPLDLDWANLDRLVVVAAHPDDETLGAAGLLQRAARHGTPVDVVVATLGEASHPDSPTHSRERLAAMRAVELRRALTELAPAARCTHVGIPDGAVAASLQRLEEAIAGVVRPGRGRTLIVAPWAGDGHPDHEAAGTAGAHVAAGTGNPYLGYPIWLWHWGFPGHGDVPWPALRRLDLDAAEQAGKRAALAHHASQVAPLSPAPGDEALLSASLLEHFRRPFETFIDAAGAFTPSGESARAWLQAQFDAIHAGAVEPWQPGSRYERRKRSLLLGALPRAEFTAALELGCSTGVLTAELAARCHRVVGVDASGEAVQTARGRNATHPHATLVQAVIPQEWPAGRFDLFVLSETGYYLSEDQLSAAVGRMLESALPGAVVIACHWRHPISGWPLSGDDVHAALGADARLRTVASYREPAFLIDVFELPGA